MKKLIIILTVVLSGIFAQHAFAQSGGDVSLEFRHLVGNDTFVKIDYSALAAGQIEKLKDGSGYTFTMPFTVRQAIPADNLFWLALFCPKGGSFQSWGIFTEDMTFICNSFSTFRLASETYILQSQDDLTQQVVPGKYYLKVTFTEMPKPEDLWLLLGHSTRSYYKIYYDHLEKQLAEYTAAERYVSLNFRNITTDIPEYETIDYSQIGSNWYRKTNDGYVVTLPFIFTEAIPAGEIFRLALYEPKGSDFSGWELRTGDGTSLTHRQWKMYLFDDRWYMLLSQDDLTQPLVPNQWYYLTAQFTNRPGKDDLHISVGRSTRQRFDNYAASLEREKALYDKYDYVGGYDSNGLAKVKIGEKYGLIDRSERVILSAEHDEVTSEALFVDLLDYYLVRKGGKAWLIDKTGRQITDTKLDAIHGFNSHGYAWVTQEDGVEYFIDRTGKRTGPIYEEVHGWVEGYDFFSDPIYYRVKRYGDWGVIDARLNVVVPYEYDRVKLFDETSINGRTDSRNAAVVQQGRRCYRIILQTGERSNIDCNF